MKPVPKESIKRVLDLHIRERRKKHYCVLREIVGPSPNSQIERRIRRVARFLSLAEDKKNDDKYKNELRRDEQDLRTAINKLENLNHVRINRPDIMQYLKRGLEEAQKMQLPGGSQYRKGTRWRICALIAFMRLADELNLDVSARNIATVLFPDDDMDNQIEKKVGGQTIEKLLNKRDYKLLREEFPSV